MLHQNSAWPPRYTIRRSQKAKRVSLSIHPINGLEVVLPLRAQQHEALAFLNLKRNWVEKHLARLSYIPENLIKLPEQIHLKAIDCQFTVTHRVSIDSIEKNLLLDTTKNELIFSSDVPCTVTFKELANQLLRKLAQQHLPRMLNVLSQQINLPYHKLSIRSQKTLWGSCTREKNISLNDRILFLPKPLARYILIHELCHTKYMTHGKRFWQLVERFDPDCQANEKALKKIDELIPIHFR